VTKKGTKTPWRKRQYRFEFSAVSLCLWSLIAFFILGWIFVLGILVGGGMLPEEVRKLWALKTPPSKIGPTGSEDDDPLATAWEEPKFAFYNELSAKKEEVKRKSRSLTEVPQAKSTSRDSNQAREGEGEYTLQLASLDDESKAARFAEELIGRGYPAYFYEVELKGKTYFRVRCGRFKTRKEAGEFGRMLSRKEKIKGFISRVEK